MGTLKLRRWDSAEHLKTEEDMVMYLQACMEEAGDDAAFIAKARSSLPQDGPLALRKRHSAGRGLHLPSGNARLGNPDRQAPTSHNRAIIQRRGWRNPRSTFGEMLPLPFFAGAAYRPLRALRDAPRGSRRMQSAPATGSLHFARSPS